MTDFGGCNDFVKVLIIKIKTNLVYVIFFSKLFGFYMPMFHLAMPRSVLDPVPSPRVYSCSQRFNLIASLLFALHESMFVICCCNANISRLH